MLMQQEQTVLSNTALEEGTPDMPFVTALLTVLGLHTGDDCTGGQAFTKVRWPRACTCTEPGEYVSLEKERIQSFQIKVCYISSKKLMLFETVNTIFLCQPTILFYKDKQHRQTKVILDIRSLLLFVSPLLFFHILSSHTSPRA